MSQNKNVISIRNTDKEITEIFTRLSEMRQSLDLVDCSLRTDDGTVFPAHKILLFTSSPYFLKHFQGQRKLPMLVAIPNVKPNVLKIILDFVYFQPIEIPFTILWDVLAAAEKWEFTMLVQQCYNYLKDNLKACDCSMIFHQSKQHNLIELASVAKRYIVENFNHIPVNCDSLMNLQVEELQEVLMDDRISCREEHLWTVIKHWLEKYPDNRKDCAPKLLSCIRLGFIDTSFIFQNIMRHELIFSNEECRNLVTQKLELMWDIAKMQSLAHVETKYIAKPRLPSDLLFSVKTVQEQDGKEIGVIEVYDHKADIWLEVQEDLEPVNTINRTDHVCIILEHCLYVIGGRDRETGTIYNTVNCFNLCKKQWYDVPPMNKPRYGMAAAVSSGIIFVIGGSLEKHILYSVETYDPKDKSWTFTSCLKKSRCFASAATLGQCIYVVGGTSNHANSLRSAEVFQWPTSSWSQIASMREPRRGSSSVSSDDKVFVAGGSDTTVVERYDPQSNSWTIFSQMKEPRSFFKLAVLDGVLYAIGGVKQNIEQQCEEPSGSEMYHEETNTWRSVENSIHHSCAGSACVATDLPNLQEYLYTNRQNLLEVKRKLLLQNELKNSFVALSKPETELIEETKDTEDEETPTN